MIDFMVEAYVLCDLYIRWEVILVPTIGFLDNGPDVLRNKLVL